MSEISDRPSVAAANSDCSPTLWQDYLAAAGKPVPQSVADVLEGGLLPAEEIELVPQTKTFGTDISQYQGPVDWSKLASHKEFAFIRASHGREADDSFGVNWSAAKSVGMIRGPYHFFNPRQSVEHQLKAFVGGVRKLEAGDLPPVVDIEKPSLWRGIKLEDRSKLVMQWIQGVEKAFGVKPIIYSSPKFLQDNFGDATALKQYPVWVAHYNVDKPALPQTWQHSRFWQFSESGMCLGVATTCDQNVFSGSRKELQNHTLKEDHVADLKSVR